VRSDDRDRRLLEFASHHRLILVSQAALLLRTDPEAAKDRLAALKDAGLMRDARRKERSFPGEQITGAGLRAIGSPLRAPQRSAPGGYEHDVGLAWLWLTARTGAFGSLRGIVSERHMRSHDRRTADRAERYGVRLGGVGPAGQERLHYPDLVLETASGRRVAVELELSGKGQARLQTILAGYAADPRIDAIVYMVERPNLAANIRRTVSRMGISDLVHVQPVSFEPRGSATTATEAARRLSARTAKPVAALEAG
jgi:hypothetical protein